MEMKDMKLTKADRKKMQPTVAGSMSGPDYPWGLEINLDDAALKKLGITELPEVGGMCMIHAMGKVTSVRESAHANANGKSEDRSMTIQVTKLALMESMGDDDDNKAVARGYAKASKRI